MKKMQMKNPMRLYKVKTREGKTINKWIPVRKNLLEYEIEQDVSILWRI